MKSVLLLSPHLDDVAISCSDHAVKWSQLKIKLHVLSIFTDFGEHGATAYQNRFINEQGFDGTKDFGIARRIEDQAAMQEMGFDYSHLGELDAAFRRDGENFLYEDYRRLTSWEVDAPSEEVLERLTKHLKTMKSQYDHVVIPLGVGGHIDHWITRKAAESVWAAGKRIYYLDFPYALRPWKYRLKLAKDIFSHRISLLPFSDQKHTYLKHYKSQMPYLFRKRPSFSEVLLFPKIAT